MFKYLYNIYKTYSCQILIKDIMLDKEFSNFKVTSKKSCGFYQHLHCTETFSYVRHFYVMTCKTLDSSRIVILYLILLLNI